MKFNAFMPVSPRRARPPLIDYSLRAAVQGDAIDRSRARFLAERPEKAQKSLSYMYQYTCIYSLINNECNLYTSATLPLAKTAPEIELHCHAGTCY
jgi:hypothetical protein